MSATQQPTPDLEAVREHGRPPREASDEAVTPSAAEPHPVDDPYLLTLERVITATSQAGEAAVAIVETLAAMADLPGVDAAVFHDIDRVSGKADLIAEHDLPESTQASFTHFDISTPPLHNALIQRQPVYLEDVAGLRELGDMLAPFDALAMVPVVANDDVVGAVSVLALKPRDWSHKDQSMLPPVGRELGAALSRLAARAALRDRRLPMHDLFDAVGEMLAVAAADGRMLWANAALERRLGLSGADWPHMTMLDLHPPGRRIEAAAVLAGLLERGEGVSHIPLLARDGTHVEVETRIRWGTWDGRRVLYMMCRETLSALPAGEDMLLESTLKMITAIAYLHDPATAEHSRRVTRLAASLGDALGLPPERIAGLRLAAGLHDVGKTAIPADVLLRPGRLSAPEVALVRAHPAAGFEMVREAESPWPLAEIILQHHERLDGSGYPRGLHAGEILTEARILAVADVFEAMSSSRPYRDAYSVNEALQELRSGSGRRYDRDVVAACVQMTENDDLPVH